MSFLTATRRHVRNAKHLESEIALDLETSVVFAIASVAFAIETLIANATDLVPAVAFAITSVANATEVSMANATAGRQPR